MYFKICSVVFVLFVFNAVTALSVSDDQVKEEPRTSRHSKSKSKESKRTKILEEVTPEIDRNEKEDNLEQPPFETESTFRTEDDERTEITDVTNTEDNLNHKDYHIDDYASENSRVENDHLDNIHENLDTDYVDPLVIDVKGRSGYVPEEIPANAIPEDYIENIFNSHEFRSEFVQPRHPLKEKIPQFYGHNPRFTYKDLLLPYHNFRYPAYWNKMSREVIFPNSQENAWDQYYGQYAQNNPQFRSSDYNNCVNCHRSQEHNIKSVDIPYQTANGRPLENEPLGSNSYPYFARDANNGNQEISTEKILGRTQDFSYKHDKERSPKFIVQKNSPIMMNRRVGLTGYHILSGFK